MRKLFADVVAETTATAGAGTLTLALLTGFVRFASRFSVGDLVYYSIRNGSNWEIGKGTVGAANTLARTTILGTLVAGTWTSGGGAITLAGASIVRAVATEHLLTQITKHELSLVSISTVMVEGFDYGVQASALTLTLPATPAVNDRVGVYQAAAAITGTIVDPGAGKINNVAGTMTIDVSEFAMCFVYISAGYGWKLLP